MAEKGDHGFELARVETGVPRFDQIVGGGFFRGGVYLIAGLPGSGKTIFGNQVCFNRARAGDSSVFVTLLAESHARMLQHLHELKFFEESAVGTKIHYFSAFSTLEKKGLEGVRDLLRKAVEKHHARLLVVDGMHAAFAASASPNAMQRFVRELQTMAGILDCTMLLLSPLFSEEEPSAAVVDGVIELTHRQFGPRAVRELTVHKFRGSPNLLGRHEVEIDQGGMVVHPRTEIVFSKPPEHATEDRVRLGLGLPALDQMLMGGVLSSSTTMLLGAPGTGKTVLGLQFLAEGARRDEPGVYFGFYETPPRLLEKAASLGIDLHEAVDKKKLEIQWQPPLEHNLDSLAERLLERIRERRVERMRLFIDGLAGFRDAAVYPDRLRRFFAALTHELRQLDVTTMVSEETALFHTDVELPNEEFASNVENIILLRHLEYRGHLRRLIAILKSRESEYDPGIREFFIRRRGVTIGERYETAEGLLTGVPKEVAPARRTRSAPRRRPKTVKKKTTSARRKGAAR